MAHPDKEHYRKSITVDGITKTIDIEQVENGYIVRISKYGQVGEDYIDENKTYISASDPREKFVKEEEKEEAPSEGTVLSAVGGFLEM
jgi:hypothetical protein